MTGAQALVTSLLEEGVDTVFGYPGGTVLPIFDALMLAEDKLNTVLVRHEQGATHMADGYARSTGRPGVVIVTSGPGATNTVTGIATAYMDSVPLVVITGQVATSVLGTDAFQESDITGITMPITKHSYLVKDAEELPLIVKEAFEIATTGRPGPVVIDLPVDVSRAIIDFEYPEKINLPGYKPTVKGNARQIKTAAAAIERSTRPLLFVGGGIITAGASAALKDLAELLQIPVTATLIGKGAFPESHHLSLGMPGMHGARYANYAMTDADLIIAVGVRFDDRVTGKLSSFAAKATVVHVDVDPAEIGKNVPVDVPVVGDAKDILERIVAELRKSGAQPRTAEWLEQIDEWRAAHPLHAHQASGEPIHPPAAIERIDALTRGRERVITTEVGQNQMWAAQFIKLDTPRSFLSSGGLGTMGYGLPAAIGAQVGRPNALVMDIAGDGSIQMNSQEMATAKIENLPVKVMILNNGCLGMVRQWQELFYEERYSCSILETVPDFVKLADAYGWKGVRVVDPAQLDDAIREVIDHDGPALLDIVVAGQECVWPMVAPGNSIDEMLGGIGGAAISEMLDEEGE